VTNCIIIEFVDNIVEHEILLLLDWSGGYIALQNMGTFMHISRIIFRQTTKHHTRLIFSFTDTKYKTYSVRHIINQAINLGTVSH